MYTWILFGLAMIRLTVWSSIGKRDSVWIRGDTAPVITAASALLIDIIILGYLMNFWDEFGMPGYPILISLIPGVLYSLRYLKTCLDLFFDEMY